MKLADALLAKRLTVLGTIRQNNQDIPDEFRPSRARSVGSSVFGFADDKTLVSYVPAKTDR